MANKFSKKVINLINKNASSAYNSLLFEELIYDYWEQNNLFAPSGSGEPFTVIMPPPNLTGELHLGHALTVAVEDSLIRWNRMLGKQSLWLPGVDHAAIAVNAIVEKQLIADGISRKDLGREKFLDHVWKFVNNSRKRITSQHRRLGASVDWKRWSLENFIKVGNFLIKRKLTPVFILGPSEKEENKITGKGKALV